MKSSKTYQNVGLDLTDGNILEKLIIFALPIILTNLVQQLYSITDIAIIGKYVGSVGSVAVSTGGEISDLMTPVAMGFSTAGQIYIAQLFGAKMMERVKESIGTLLTMMLLLSLICTFGSIVFCESILNMLNCPLEAIHQAKLYMIITSMGFPFIFGYNAVVGILRGMGESKRPLFFVCIAACINVFMDILLVVIIPLSAAGTAIATVLSQAGAFFSSFYFMYKHKEKFDFSINIKYFRINAHIASLLIKLAVPQVFRSMFVRFSMMWVNSNINSYGLIVSATNSIGTKIQKFLEVFVQGIDTAAAAMVGQNLGAKKFERAKQTIITTLICCLILAFGCCFFSLVFPQKIYGLLTNDPNVIVLGKQYLQILCIHFIVSAITSTFQAMVTGSGFVSLGFVLGILDGIICRIGFSLFFYHIMNLDFYSFWWGTSFARVLTGMVCIAYFISGKWKERKLLSEQ